RAMLATGGGAWYLPPQAAATRSSRAVFFTAFSSWVGSEPGARDQRDREARKRVLEEVFVRALVEQVLRLDVDPERSGCAQLDARDARLADVERFHPRRGKQLVKDELAVARPERGGRERQQRQAPLDARIDRPGALGLQIRIGGDAAALEIELAERRRAVREPPSRAQRQRMLRRGFPLRGGSRTDPGLRADLVQANGRMQGEPRRERQIVGSGCR